MAAFVLAMGLVLISASTCHVVLEHEDLDAAVRAALWDFKGSVGIYAEDLDSGRVYARNEDQLFPTASVFKVPVMIEFFRRVESVELLTDQTQEWAGGIARHGSGVLKEREHPGPLPLLELCRLMIAHSDNIATDMLMQVVSAASVSATMDELGFPNTHVGGNCTEMHYQMADIDSRIGSPALDELLLKRAQSGSLVEAGFASASPDGNVTTPREMGLIFKQILRGEMVSELASQQMIEILKQTTDRRMIPRHLPSGTEVAHKIGGTWRVKADVGIVYSESGPVVVSLFAYYHRSETRAADVLAEIARVIADWARGQGRV